MKINGIEYENKELDFTNVLCDLEDKGIDIMGMATGGQMKIFSLARGIVSVYTGEKDLNECGKILSQHVNNGGNLEDIVNPFVEAMHAAGFGKEATEEKTAQETAEAEKQSKTK
jgi:hypothetical protein